MSRDLMWLKGSTEKENMSLFRECRTLGFSQCPVNRAKVATPTVVYSTQSTDRKAFGLNFSDGMIGQKGEVLFTTCLT